MRAGPRALWPYLLIAPTVLGATFLLAYPLVRNLVISFQHYGMAELIRGGAGFAGLENYREILGDTAFWEVVRRTLWWTALNVVLIMVLGTVVALMLQRLRKGLRILVMSGLVLAWASPVIATTTVFQWLFSSRLGVVNWLLVRLGFDSFGTTPGSRTAVRPSPSSSCWSSGSPCRSSPSPCTPP